MPNENDTIISVENETVEPVAPEANVAVDNSGDLDDSEIPKSKGAVLTMTSPSDKNMGAVLKGKRILWVEDDTFLGSILKKKISGYGCDVFLAKNGDEVFTYLARQVPHVIVLDLVLPGMSGFDILKKIRDVRDLKEVPVLILSNLNQRGDIEHAKLLGAEKFLVKAAVSLDQIIAQVKLMVK